MKKSIITFLLMSISIFLYSQNKMSDSEILKEFDRMKSHFTESGGEWVFSRIINIDGLDKDAIYVKALGILTSAYKDSKEVIQTKDKEAGIIIGKGLFASNIRTISSFLITRNQCYHIIKIETKDNRCRVSIIINSILVDTGADLRRPFEGVECQLRSFYPYNTSEKPKNRQSSFENLRFVYDESMDMLDYIESEFKKADDNW